MNIHEYQTKELLRGYGVPVPAGRVAHNVDNAVTIAEDLGGERWVVKAQIHAGGRGKGGGVKVANSLDEVRHHTDEMIGIHLVTPQTGAGRAPGAARAGGAGQQHRKGILPGPGDRPCQPAHDHHRLGLRWHEHRGSREGQRPSA